MGSQGSAPAAAVQTLEVLLAQVRGMGRDGFLKRHPEPALVVVGALGRAVTIAAGFFTLEDKGGDVSTPSASRIYRGAPFWSLRKAHATFPDKITVGRVASNDIIISETSVSKLHAYFLHRGPQVRLVDAESRNGTFVDGTRLAPLTPTEVRDGQLIGFGPGATVAYLGAESFYQLLTSGLVR